MIRSIGFAFALSVCVTAPAGAQSLVTPGGIKLPDGFLAEGPFPIVIKGTSPAGLILTEKGSLAVLTKDKLIYLTEQAGIATTREARLKRVKTIESADGKRVWKLDEEKLIFTGPTVLPEDIDFKPAPCTAAEESRYLFFTLERLHQRLESAIGADRARLVDALVKEADAFAAHMRGKGLDPEVLKQFGRIGAYAKSQEALQRKYREEFAAALARADALRQARYQSQASAALGGLFGFLAEDPVTMLDAGRQ